MAEVAKVEEVKVAPDSRLYVSNLKWELTDDELKIYFGAHGKVVEARIVRDRRTNWSRGYGFVTFETKEDAAKALAALNGKELKERALRVEIARSTGPTAPRPPGDATATAGAVDANGVPTGARRGRGGRFRGRGRGGRVRGRGRFRGRGRRARGDANDDAGAAAPQTTNGDQQ